MDVTVRVWVVFVSSVDGAGFHRNLGGATFREGDNDDIVGTVRIDEGGRAKRDGGEAEDVSRCGERSLRTEASDGVSDREEEDEKGDIWRGLAGEVWERGEESLEELAIAFLNMVGEVCQANEGWDGSMGRDIIG